ncbi:Protein kinase-like (PK-like) [Glarea lozoyensis ATCC 20868]|uniref:Protein kinase-like (PK-like) n=1 Tax=Glarea lozoyensis (strain ATCC 20868 / MF5171) TaxID=1116229 RepID=S3DMJ8_GLAL2|nr:Protein kinase-like (PK-like) [Glarea lozoyensis ATCC 20868]EPE33286.1 Protein kinase-like (PK-like) [Glarea lozoyensis ATCC 20868]
MTDGISYPRILGNYEPEYSVLAASRRTVRSRIQRHSHQPLITISEDETEADGELPSILRILNHYFHETSRTDSNAPFINNVIALHDVEFSAKFPVLGMGHNFAVWASPFDPDDRGYKTADGRAINPEVYCLKTPNFTSGGNLDNPQAFQKEYYDTTLQELRVLLHPQLRKCEHIISIFGLDFQEDYDDSTLAWPVLLMEYAEYGTFDTLQEDIHMDVELCRVLLLDVARGIRALHQCNIVHGDVKSENVLICRHQQRKYTARLSDFGLSVVNPDVSKIDHRLPGETFLWGAPESDQPLTVEGLFQTDVFSFGLMAWRVFRHHPNPYRLIPLVDIGLNDQSSLREIVDSAKSHHDFQRLVLNSMWTQRDTPHYFHLLVGFTLGRDSMSRSLDQTIFLLAQGQGFPAVQTLDSKSYWLMEQPFTVLENLQAAHPDSLLSYSLKPAMLLSLASGLSSVFESATSLAVEGGWLLFRLSSDTHFMVLQKDEQVCCDMLVRLCKLGCLKAKAIIAQYHIITGKPTGSIPLNWLEEAASTGSYFAKESLRMLDVDRFQRLMGRPLNFEHVSTESDAVESDLHQACRYGDYLACEKILNGQDSLAQQDSGVSPYHWLISFSDETKIQNLITLLIRRGVPLGLWEGDTEDDYNIGKVVGTPLCWAVWHRNCALTRQLLKAMKEIKVEVMNRLITLAACMHFFDIMEILRTSKIRISNASKPDWQTALLCAGDTSDMRLARRLRHGDNNLRPALDRTFDTLLKIYQPTKDDVEALFKSAFYKDSPYLLRYLFDKLNLSKRKDLLGDKSPDLLLITVAAGQKELFETFIARGLINPSTEHGRQKWRPLQVCCFTRQPDPYFARRLIEIGCPVDGVGSTKDTIWTPFAISVCSGRFAVATALLELGANKNALFGWLGGTSVTMNLLQSWPDIPISRLKYLLEDVPRLGFGHVNFWGWPGAGGNLLYALAMNHWPSYTNGNRLEETAKYILSQVADKSCLNRIDKMGQTALRMACAFGNYEICRALVEAGQDVNMSAGPTPLNGALEWRGKCYKKEREALANPNGPGRVGRQAQTLRIRAEMTVDFLIANGAVDRGIAGSVQSTSDWWYGSGREAFSYETIFEMFSSAIDSRSSVNPGSTPLNPSSANDFRAHHGNKTWIQKRLANLGKRLDGNAVVEIPKPRYSQHNCLPWRDCGCSSNAGLVYEPQGMRPSVPTRPSSVSTVSSGSNSSRLYLQTPASSTSSLPTFENSSQRRQSLPFIPPQHYGVLPKPAIQMPAIAELPGEPVGQQHAMQLPIRVVRPQSLPPGASPYNQPGPPRPPSTSSYSQPGSHNLTSTIPSYIQPSTRSPPPATSQYIQPVSYVLPTTSTFVHPRPQIHSVPPTFLNVVDERGNAVPVTTAPGFSQTSQNSVFSQRYNQNHSPASYTPVYVPTYAPTPLPVQSPYAQPFPQQQPLSPTTPQHLQPVLDNIKTALLLHFLEGGGMELSREALISHTYSTLQSLLRAPIILSNPGSNIQIEECAEFKETKAVVERCLETMGIGGCISLIAELGDGLVGIHVCLN